MSQEVRKSENQRGNAMATYEINWDNPGDREIVDFVMSQYEAGKDRRIRWERQAAQQLAWVRGNQNYFWDRDSNVLAELSLLDGKILLDSEQERALHERFPMQINMLKRFIMSWIGLVMAKPIGWHVFPKTTDNADVQAAKLATSILEYYWSSGITHGMTRLLAAMWHMYATGVIWIKPTWDPQKHYAEHFSEATDQKNLPKGDLEYDFVTGFELTEPEGARSVEDCAWLIESRLRTIEWGMERYGEKFKDVEPDSRAKDNKLYYYEMSELDWGENVSEGHAPDDRVLVHEIWRPKSATIKEGYFGVVADDQFIHGGDHPYDHGRLPQIALQEQPDFENFRPGSSIRDLMSLQHARNKNRSQRQAHMDKTINPTIVKESGVTIVDGGFEIDAPQIVTVSGGAGILASGQIKAWDQPKLPPDMMQLEAINKADMEDVAGVHANTMGRPESASQSGRHAIAMTQGDARTQAVTRMLHEKAMGKVGQQGLWLLYQFVEEKRMLPIVGSNRIAQVRNFKGSDLSKEGNEPYGPYEFNVGVTIGTEPDMQAVMARIDVLTERGWLRPDREEDRQLVMKWLGEEVVQNNDPREAHRENARSENERIVAGEIGPPSMGDDDEIHFYEHQLFRTTAEYKSVEDSEALEKRMDLHIRTHWRQGANKRLEPRLIAMSEQIVLLKQYDDVAQMMQRQQAAQQQQGPGGGRPQPRPQAGGGSPGGNGNVAARRSPVRTA